MKTVLLTILFWYPTTVWSGPSSCARPTVELTGFRLATMDTPESFKLPGNINLQVKVMDSPLIYKGIAGPPGQEVTVYAKRISSDPAAAFREVRRAWDGNAALSNVGMDNIRVPRTDILLTPDGSLWAVGEYMPGRPWSEVMEEVDRPSKVDWKIFEDKIHQIHAQGVTHRDLHGENIRVAKRPDGTWEFQLIDWDGKNWQAVSTDDLEQLIENDVKSLEMWRPPN